MTDGRNVNRSLQAPDYNLEAISLVRGSLRAKTTLKGQRSHYRPGDRLLSTYIWTSCDSGFVIAF
jgi:hypothetical protein